MASGQRQSGGVPAAPRGADRAGARRGGAALLLETLRADGPRSRATLARRTGLPKTAVSLLVADLVARGLVREGAAPAGVPGRPGTLVEIAPRGAVALGLAVDGGGVSAGVVDLGGALLASRRAALDAAAAGAAGVADALDGLARTVLAAAAADPARVVGSTVAVPGAVDPVAAVVRDAPALGWRDVPLADLLTARGRAGTAGPVGVDAAAALAAVAERAAGAAAGASDVVHLVGTGDGVAGAVVAGGQLVRGARGAAGDVAHLTVDPAGPYCGCGRRGCWGTQVGLDALLTACALPDAGVDPGERVRTVRARALDGDPRTVAALRRVGSALGAGTALLVTVVDPAVVVLGGWYAELADLLLPAAAASLAERAPVGATPPRLVASALGRTAVVRGAAEVALRRVLADPTLVAPPRAAADPIGARA